MKTKMQYLPLTAIPFKCSSVYQEISPCPVLQPYVRCFWGGESCCLDTETEESSEIVIPDTCVDIIYRIDLMREFKRYHSMGIRAARVNEERREYEQSDI